METIAVFERKTPRLEAQKCVVEKMVELPKQEYRFFCNHLLEEQDFIKENRDLMYVDDEERYHCLLVLEEGGEDGILVEAEGSNYARYAAALPNARMMWEMHQHPTLKKHYDNALIIYEAFSGDALLEQKDGRTMIDLSDVFSHNNSIYLTKSLVEDLLEEHPAFESVESTEFELLIRVAKYAQEPITEVPEISM